MKINKLFNPILKMKYAFAALLCLGLFQANTVKAQATGDAWGFLATELASGLNQGSMYQFDLTDASATELGPLCGGGGTRIFNGEFVNNVYYAIDQDAFDLLSVAPDGSCTTIANVGFAPSGLSHDLSTDITYALDFTGDLFTIDLTTGATTLVGNTGFAASITLAIDGQGNAFMIDLNTNSIVPIDLATAQPTGPGVPITEGGNPITLNFGQDIDFDCDEATGMLFGTIFDADNFVTRFGTLDPATGVYTTITNIDAQITGFSINTTAIVPTMSEWGLFLFALLMVNLGLVFMYRQERTLNLA